MEAEVNGVTYGIGSTPSKSSYCVYKREGDGPSVLVAGPYRDEEKTVKGEKVVVNGHEEAEKAMNRILAKAGKQEQPEAPEASKKPKRPSFLG